MLVLLFACAPDPDGVAPAFVVEPVDLGEPRADGTGYDPTDGDRLGLGLAWSVPAFGDNPAWDTPDAVLALLDPATVRDPAACPLEEVDGDVRIWRGGCRSSQGYEFVGEATTRAWTEDAVSRYRWEGTLEVIGDREDPVFDRILVDGVFEQAVPAAGTVTQHLDANLHLEVEGYWERHGGSEDELDAWSSWTLTGSLEQRDTFWVSEVAAEVGSSGGFRFDSAELHVDPSCPIEGEGVGALGDGHTAELGGVASCDGCADVDGEKACRP